MSLRARLTFAIVGLVTTLVMILSAVYMHRLIGMTLDDVHKRAEVNATQVSNFVLQRLKEKTEERRPPPQTLDEKKRLWAEIIEQDPFLGEVLRKAMANSSLVIEILISDDQGRILTASNPSHAGGTYPALPDYLQWNDKALLDRLFEVFTTSQDYAISKPLGVGTEVFFTIRVVISYVLLRAAIRPDLDNVIWVGGLSLLTSFLAALLFSEIFLRPLGRIKLAIERISAGEFSPLARTDRESREFADLQSKLGFLGQRFRGAQDDVMNLQANIETLMRRMQEAVLLFDRNQKLVMAGDTVESLLGLKAKDIVGKSLAEIFREETALGSTIQTAVGVQQPLRNCVVEHHPAGLQPIRLMVTVDWVEDNTQRQHSLMVTLRDAESRQQLASHLDVSTRMAAINRLTGGVAHEIKNPLNAIALHLEVLKTKVASEGIDNIEEIDVISKEISRLDRVVKTFLNFTRPVQLQMRSVEVAELLDEVLALVRPDAARRKIEVVFKAEGDGATVYGDYDLLKQAILNVVVNGVEAMQEGGKLEIRLNRAAAEVVLEVVDQGPGIPPEIREKIFQLYFTTKKAGSGIGLAMTFQAVQMHGGAIDFSSGADNGTTFRLRFPAVDQPQTVGAGV